MGTEQKLSLTDIIDINNAISGVENESIIPFKTSYKLGLLGSYCKPFIDGYNKEAKKLSKAFNEKREELLATYKGKEEKDIPEAVKEELQALLTKLNADTDELKAFLHEIKVPEFKLDEFQASEDTKQLIMVNVEGKQQVETHIIKKGQSLVPIRFFKLMASIIKA